MSADEIKTTIHRVFDELFNKGNVDVLDEMFATDFVYHRMAGYPQLPDSDLQHFEEAVSTLRQTWPKCNIEEIILDRDNFAIQWSFEGTQASKGFTWRMCLVGHMRNGKIVEAWSYGDLLGRFQHRGIVPPIEQLDG